MSIIVNGFHEPQYFPIINEFIDIYKPEKCHIIYQAEKITPLRLTQINFYACATLSHQTDYGVDLNSLLPLDAEIILKMADCEATCLKMFDRDEVYAPLSYNERKNRYLKHLRYWNHVFETENVTLFVSSNIPHVIYDYIIYELCKLKKIETIFFIQFQRNFSIIVRDWKDLTPNFSQKLKELNFDITTDDLSERIKQEWLLQTTGKDTTPFYIDLFKQDYDKPIESIYLKIAKYVFIQFLSIFRSPQALKEKFLSPSRIIKSLSLLWNSYEEKQREKKTSIEYEKRCKEPNLSEKYIYLPLHSQPELSTSPMGGVFVDQLLIVQLVASSIPSDVKIYVKEHPTQYLHKRDHDFYNSLEKIKNVQLISRNFSSAKLIESSLAIGTCVGTAGWEGLFKGKPTLLFGNTFFQNFPGIFMIETKEECLDAVTKIYNREPIFTQQDLLKALYLLNHYFIYANIDPMYIEQNNLTGSDENIKKLVSSLRSFLKL